MWILEEKRLREVQKGRLREDVKRSHVVEDRRLHPSVPGLKAEGRHREVIDDWFLLLEPVSKKSGKKKNFLGSLSHLSVLLSDLILISSLSICLGSERGQES